MFSSSGVKQLQNCWIIMKKAAETSTMLPCLWLRERLSRDWVMIGVGTDGSDYLDGSGIPW